MAHKRLYKSVGQVYYELVLPAELDSGHVSMFKKCLGEPASLLRVEVLGVDKDLYYEEVPI